MCGLKIATACFIFSITILYCVIELYEFLGFDLLSNVETILYLIFLPKLEKIAFAYFKCGPIEFCRTLAAPSAPINIFNFAGADQGRRC